MPVDKQHGVILGYVLYVRKADDIESTPKVYNTSLNSITLKGRFTYLGLGSWDGWQKAKQWHNQILCKVTLLGW